MTYYNEFDPHAARWLRNLCDAGLITPGAVDGRDVKEVRADEVRAYRRCHFFAGIGGWDHALALAGWDATRSVWTASCPCQPFSTAGKGESEKDGRHLWPVLSALVRQCRPDCVFGEQVASRAGYEWLDGVRADLEAEGYAFGAADLPACCAGAPHVRQRLFWVAALGTSADTMRVGNRRPAATVEGGNGTHDGIPGKNIATGDSPDAVGSARERNAGGISGAEASGGGAREFDGRLPVGSEHGVATGTAPHGAGFGERGEAGDVPDLHRGRQQERTQRDGQAQAGQQPSRRGDVGGRGLDGFWDAFDVLDYRDGKQRRVEPGTFPLAHGVPARLVKLRGYGNAIVPPVAALFVRAFLEAEAEGR